MRIKHNSLMLANGKTMRDTRHELGYTLLESAERLGVSIQAVQKWETGHALPSRSKDEVIEKVFGYPPVINTPREESRLYGKQISNLQNALLDEIKSAIFNGLISDDKCIEMIIYWRGINK